jgi:hypothetical protein
MATDGSTFLLDPAEDEILAPQFQAWLDCQEEHYMNANRLTRMLSTNAHLKTNYEKLVPEEVCDFTGNIATVSLNFIIFQMGHQQFWQRFLFRKALLEDEEARLQAKQKRLEEEKIRAEEEVQKCEST